MAIAFNFINADNRVPDIQIEFDPSGSSVPPSKPHKAILIGQRTSAGSVAEGVVKGVTSDLQGDDFFGQGSMLAAEIRAFRSKAPGIALYAVALDDDGAAVNATGTLTMTGTATAADIMNFWIHQTRIRVAVAVGDTMTVVVAALAAAMLEVPDLQVTGAAALGVLTLTSRNPGEAANEIDLRVLYNDDEKIPAGLTAVVVPMASGAGNPDVGIALTAMGGSETYDTIVMPYHDAANLTAMEIELEARWGPDRQNDGLCFTGIVADHTTTQTLGDSRNSHMLVLLGFGPVLMTPWEGSSIIAGIDAAMPSPARPRQRREVTGMLPPASGTEFNTAERELLLHDGVSTVRPAAGGRMQIERLITMHQVNSSGFQTIAYLNVTKVRTLSVLRFSIRAFIASKYPDYNLAPNETEVAPGAAVVTPNTIKADLLGLYDFFGDQGWVVDKAKFKEALLVEINDLDPDRLDVLLYPTVIGALRFMAGRMVFA